MTYIIVLSSGGLPDVHQQQLCETHDLEGAARRQELRALPTQPGPGGFPQQVRRHSAGAAKRLGDQNRPPGQGMLRTHYEYHERLFKDTVANSRHHT